MSKGLETPEWQIALQQVLNAAPENKFVQVATVGNYALQSNKQLITQAGSSMLQ